jgi:hypothetical protein
MDVHRLQRLEKQPMLHQMGMFSVNSHDLSRQVCRLVLSDMCIYLFKVEQKMNAHQFSCQSD